MSNKLALLVSFVGNDKLSGAIRNIIGTGKTGGQVLKGMAREAAGLERELGKVRREIASASGNVTSLVTRERELQGQLERTNEQLRRQKRLVDINATANKISARGDELKDRGRDNIVQGAALAAPIVLAVKAAGDFSSGMVDIQQKANLTNRETDKLARNIILAADAARQMPEDMRSAVDVLAGKGLDPLQAARMIPAIGRLGTAFKVDLADGADAAFANLNNLKVPIDQTSAALDIMAASGNRGAFEMRDMARTFPGLTAQMQALGESGLSAVGNLSAALQIARTGTGSADEAANNIQNLLAKINSPATIRAFQQNFGVDLPAAMARMKAQGIDTFEAIALVTQKATGGDLKKLGFAFEDMQAQGAIRSLIQNLKDYRKIRDESMKSSGTIDAAFDQRLLRDANVNWTKFKSSVSQVAITLGATLLPEVVQVFDHISATADAVAGWAREHPQAAAMILQVVAAVAAFKIGLGALQFLFGGILGPMSTLYKLFGRLFPSGILASRAFGILAKGAILFSRGMLIAGRALLANPMLLIVATVAYAAYEIWKHWDKIKGAFGAGAAFMGRIWTWLKSNAVNILAFAGPLGFAASLVIKHWSAIKAAFLSAANWIGGMVIRFVTIGKMIVDGLVAGIKAEPGKVWNVLKWIVMKGVNGIKSFLGIASPSRLFAEMGGHVSSGLALGIDKGGRRPIGSMKRLAAGVAAAGAMTLGGGAAMAGGAGSPRGSPAPVSASAGPVTINIYPAAGQDAKAIADEVMRRLQAAQGVKRRSAFDDDI